MTDRELMQQALYALQESKPIDINDPTAFYRSAHAIDALRARLEQPEQEWQGLTDDEINTAAYNNHPLDGIRAFARAVESKLKEKNGFA